ncbi:MAG: metallophosphoesterase [Bacilli bacterium]|nr:metallophosphoesterase [Bacilli bacterium]
MNRFVMTTDKIYNKNIKKDINIIHISDIHFSSITKPKMLDKLVSYILSNKPDYLMITGDTIDSPKEVNDKEKLKELITFLTILGKETKVLISLGNHDVMNSESFRFFDKLNDIYNVYVLNNSYYQDDYIYVSGFTLSNDYYYNLTGNESYEILMDNLDNNRKLLDNLPKYMPKVALIHSPILLSNMKVLNRLHEYDLILTGHTHNGLVPKWLYWLFRGNSGLVGPNNKLFPKVAKGNIERNIDNKKILVIISGGITKFSKNSGMFFANLNFIFNKSVNKIIIRKEDKKYED